MDEYLGTGEPLRVLNRVWRRLEVNSTEYPKFEQLRRARKKRYPLFKYILI